MANQPGGSRVSYLYHKSIDPTFVPIVIDNKWYILTEQLSRNVIDTKLSALIPWPGTTTNNIGNCVYAANLQTLPSNVNLVVNNTPLDQTVNTWPTAPMHGNVEQQLDLQRMHANYVMNQNPVNLNASPTFIPTVKQQCAAAVQTCFYRDSATNTYGTLTNVHSNQDNDIEMK